jgi:hypothetical protein
MSLEMENYKDSMSFLLANSNKQITTVIVTAEKQDPLPVKEINMTEYETYWSMEQLKLAKFPENLIVDRDNTHLGLCVSDRVFDGLDIVFKQSSLNINLSVSK